MPAKKTPDNPELFVATETFSIDIDGANVIVHRGRIVKKGDPLIKSGYFRPAEDADLVEQATAGPGEHRTVTW